LDGRKRARSVIAALSITALGGSMLVAASPSSADPDIGEVQAKVQRLYHEAERASERYNEVRIELEKNRNRLESLRADLERQERKVELVRDQVVASVVTQYQGQTLSTTSQVFLSENPEEFLSQLATISAYTEQQSQMMTHFAAQAEKLEVREDAEQREVAQIAKVEDRLAQEKDEIEEKAGAAQELLDRLKAEERARLARLEAQREREAARAAREAARERAERAATAEQPTRSAERPDPATDSTPVSSGSAGAAVDYALAQVGDAYVYGAAGPAAFDCSGLTMMAWAQAGVSLPHSSSAQMSSGPSVSSSALQPGDLVFYYSPVSHVGMYIGNGQIVHASNPSDPVNVAPVFSMPFSGAVRPG